MGHALLVGGGPVDRDQLQAEVAKEPDLIMGVDRGGLYLSELGITPQILIGDFDSLPEDYLNRFRSAGVTIETFPARKDQSDLELGLEQVLKRGVQSIRILGGLGKRLDHTLGNIGLLWKALEEGVAVQLLDRDHEVQLIDPDHTVTLQHRPGWAVSLVPFTDQVAGVTTSGLAYPLRGEDLFINSCRGIHNQFQDPVATIRISAGALLVIYFRED